MLILIDWFYPGYKAGGPIRSSLNVAIALKNIYDVYVLTTDTDHGETEPYKNITPNKWLTTLNNINIYYAKKSTLNISQLKKEISAIDADYIYLNHLFSRYFVLYPLWLKYKKEIKNKMVLCPRGALYGSALSVKPYKKKPFLKLLKSIKIQDHLLFHATNDREKNAIEHYFPGARIIVADNLPDSNQPAFISCKKNEGIIKCVFISRIVPIKNLLFLLGVLETVKAIVKLTIVGPVENKPYWEDCKKKIERFSENIEVRYEGAKNNIELVPILQNHHLFILPTKGENFGHSIFEAFMCGRPVLISDQTPWINLENKKIGWDISLSDPEKFKEIIEQVANFSQQEFDDYAIAAWEYAYNFINNSEVKKKYLQLFS